MLNAIGDSAASSIRSEYERHGAQQYYEDFGDSYRNPHEPIIARCLGEAVEKWRPNLTHVLDLAAGSGEATLALRRLGAARIDGIDPYTADAYLARTGQSAEKFAFADLAAGRLSGRRYSLIVCSFAMHLCPRSRLPGLCYELAQIAGSMLILTPHKRPVIQPEWGWELSGETILERVRSRLYRKNP